MLSKIKIRILLLFTLQVLIISLCFVYTSYLSKVSFLRSETLKVLQNVAQSAAINLDAQLHQQVVDAYLGKDDLQENDQDPTYYILHKELKKLETVHRLNTPMYTMIKNPENPTQLLFVITSASKPYFRHVYNPPAELLQIYHTGGVMPEYYDDHGAWLSACVPIKNAQGKTIAVVQADRKMAEFYKVLKDQLFHQILLALVIIAILSSVMLIYIHWGFSSNFANPIRSVVDELSQRAQVTLDISQKLIHSNYKMSEDSQRQYSSIQQIYDAMKKINEIVEENSLLLMESAEQTRIGKETIEKAHHSTQSMNKVMKEMTSSSNEVAKILKTIEQVSSNIKIIAINAEIEAAHLGGVGKNFTVIAEEIRALSLQTNSFIATISRKIETSIEKTTQGKQVHKTIADDMSRVVTESETVRNCIYHVTESFQEKHLGFDKMCHQMEDVKQIAEANALSAENNSYIIEEFQTYSKSLHISLQRLQKIIC